MLSDGIGLLDRLELACWFVDLFKHLGLGPAEAAAVGDVSASATSSALTIDRGRLPLPLDAGSSMTSWHWLRTL